MSDGRDVYRPLALQKFQNATDQLAKDTNNPVRNNFCTSCVNKNKKLPLTKFIYFFYESLGKLGKTYKWNVTHTFKFTHY